MEELEQYGTSSEWDHMCGGIRWIDKLSERQRDAIRACVAYSKDHSAAGLPGHSLVILVAELVNIIEEIEERL